jgi:hypothetical protein
MMRVSNFPMAVDDIFAVPLSTVLHQAMKTFRYDPGRISQFPDRNDMESRNFRKIRSISIDNAACHILGKCFDKRSASLSRI